MKGNMKMPEFTRTIVPRDAETIADITTSPEYKPSEDDDEVRA